MIGKRTREEGEHPKTPNGHTENGLIAHLDKRAHFATSDDEIEVQINKLRAKIGAPFKQLAALMGAAAADVPDDTGDGSKLASEEEEGALQKCLKFFKDMTHVGIKDAHTLLNMQLLKLTGEPTDDKDYLMEGLIQTAADFPDGSQMREQITGKFLTRLWNDLQHPPQSYLGAKYQYRSADGSNNSLVHPQLGAARTPYARTVKPAHIQTPARPDPGVVFDSIMTRKHNDEHPNQISSMLFYLASIIIHDLFRTSHEDPSISMTSSYLDLSPLYGSDQEEQDMMRTRVDGRIKPDCFSEARLMFFPPGVGALLIMFNRFHNYVVDNLASINEGDRFPRPVRPETTGDKEKDQIAADKFEGAQKKFDEDLFQTGRLITCGLYINIILIDYVRTILNLNQTDSNWQLNPRAPVKDLPMGVGNQVSAEFNLVYRWHSAVSEKDAKWTEEKFGEIFGKDCDPKAISKDEFLAGLQKEYRKTDRDPQKRNFNGIPRQANGTLPDQPLVDLLTASIRDCAHSFGPNRVPAVFRAIEVLGIEQARGWNLGSLNEFRKYFDLEPHRTFEDITNDKTVQDQLKHLYDHPDRVEIYPGIVVEDAKTPMKPGSGLCPPYTVSRAVLSDAVALVRGDRFYTHDYNPRTLTNWGYKLVDCDLGIDNGCVFYKLFLRAFPNHFKHDSVFAHYPLTVPSAMEEALVRLGKEHLYSFLPPQAIPHPHLVTEHKLATEIMKDQATFKVTWGAAMQYLMGDSANSFMLAGDETANAQSRKCVSKALYTTNWESQVRAYYTAKTRQLLADKSATIASFKQVDIIRDVGNLAHVHFCAELFMLPLKTQQHPHGVFTEAELYAIMSSVFMLIFFDVDPASSFPLHVKAHAATKMLGDLVQANVECIARTGVPIPFLSNTTTEGSPLKDFGIHMIQRLLAAYSKPAEMVWGHLLGTAGGMVSNQGQLFGQILEFYLLGEGKKYWPEIQRIARSDTDEDFDKLAKYVQEGARLNGETAVIRSVARDTQITEHGATRSLRQGDRVFVNLRAASHDPTAFPDPSNLSLDRNPESYIHLGYGPHACLGIPLARTSLTVMLREVARLPGLRCAAGTQGVVKKIEKKVGGGAEEYPYHAYLTGDWDGFWAFPCSLKVNWDP